MKPQPSDHSHSSLSQNLSSLEASMMETQNQTPLQQLLPQAGADIVLDPSLISNKESQKLNPELNLIDCFHSNMSSETSTDHEDHQGTNEPRVFSCNYCQRKFYSSQALGGHQNAHKRERSLAKKVAASLKTTCAAAASDNFGLLSHRFSSMASLPLHGSSNNNRSLGIQVHSTIHKPAAASWHQSSLYGHHNLRRPIDLRQPAVTPRLPAGSMSLSSSSGGGVGRFGTSSTTPRNFSPVAVAEKIGGFWWRNSSVSYLNLKSTTQDHELQKLDLSLKL